MKFSRDAAIPRIPAPHLLKQGQLQLAGASFRDLLCSLVGMKAKMYGWWESPQVMLTKSVRRINRPWNKYLACDQDFQTYT